MKPPGLRAPRPAELGLVVGSVLGSFLVLEMAWRLIVFGPAALSYVRMDSVHPIGVAGVLRPSDTPGVVYELKPDVRTWFKLVPFETNSHGLRDRDYPFTKPAGTRRVAVIGDSYAMASGVPVEEAFHSVLERRLGERSSGAAVEFLNFGVGGYSLRHYVAVLRHRAIRYDPDLILIAYCGDNDHRVVGDDYARREFTPRERSGAFFTSHLWQFFINLLEARQVPSGISDREAAYLDARFGELAAAAAEVGVPVVVAYLANRPVQPEVVARAARGHGLAWVNASEAFVDADVAEYSIFYPLDTHPNAAAHAIFADAILQYLGDRWTGGR